MVTIGRSLRAILNNVRNTIFATIWSQGKSWLVELWTLLVLFHRLWPVSWASCDKSCNCSNFFFQLLLQIQITVFTILFVLFPKEKNMSMGVFSSMIDHCHCQLDKEIWLLRPPSFLARRPGDSESRYGFSNQFLLDIQFFLKKKKYK